MKVITNIKWSILAISAFFITTKVNGQQKNYPEIGKPIPGFILKGEKSEKGIGITNETLKGKHYILDFWSTGCLSCIASFPKMDSLQSQYSENLKIFLVGLEEKKRNVSAFYKVYQKRFNLEISSVFDSITFEKFVPHGVPHIIWVNDQGIVAAITGSTEVNDGNIEKFLKNRDFPFFDVSYKANLKEGQRFDKNKPLLINGNGGNDTSYLSRSVFSEWKHGNGVASWPAVYPYDAINKCRYQVIGAPIEILYILAYFGAAKEFKDTYIDPQFSREALNEIKKRFGPERRFNYSLELPHEVANKKNIMNNMQNDLSSLFGLEAEITNKQMPCYNLIITDSAKFSKIIVNPGKIENSWAIEKKKQSIRNMPLNQLIYLLKSKILEPKRMITYNETGKNACVSFEMTGIDINDLSSIRIGLNKVGLDLAPNTKLMRVIEITKGQ